MVEAKGLTIKGSSSLAEANVLGSEALAVTLTLSFWKQ